MAMLLVTTMAGDGARPSASAKGLTRRQAVASGLTWLMALVAKAALLAVGARQRQTTLRWFVKMVIFGCLIFT